MNSEITINAIDIIFLGIFFTILLYIINDYRKKKNPKVDIKIIIKNKKILNSSKIINNFDKSDNFKIIIKEILTNVYNNDLDKLSKSIDSKLLKKLKTENDKKSEDKLKENRTFIDVENIIIIEKPQNKVLIEFSSIQTAHFTDSSGKTTKGSKNQIIKVKDFWLFKKSKNNNWILEDVLDKNK